MLILALLAVAVSARATDNTKNYKREGNTFSQDKPLASAEDKVTPYYWKDSKGNEYPIILHTYKKGEKAGRTTAYVIRTSAKTGNDYKYFLPNGEAIANEILEELNK